MADDPLSAPGLLAYIFGTRELRAIFKRKKWLIQRENNVESVQHPDRRLQVIYQSVDVAASDLHSPRAISGKGSGADRIIELAQGQLFSRDQLETRETVNLAPVNSGVWFLCVSVDGDEVRAELSLPASIEGGNFQDFIERIYILEGGGWSSTKVAPIESDVVEFEPIVTRRV